MNKCKKFKFGCMCDDCLDARDVLEDKSTQRDKRQRRRFVPEELP